MNENRIRLIVYLISPLVCILGVVYNNYGNAQFRDSIFQVQLILYFVVIVISVGCFFKYISQWYLRELRILILFKCIFASYVAVSSFYFIPLLTQWIADKSYLSINIQSDQLWSTAQIGFVVSFMGAILGAFLDFPTLIDLRIGSKLNVPFFGETGLEMNLLTEEKLIELEKEIQSWKDSA